MVLVPAAVPTPPASPQPQRTPAPVAAAALAVQVLVILAFSVFYAVELAQGLGDDGTRVAMSIVVFVIGAAGLGALAWALWRGDAWPRTPAVMWNALLVPLAISLMQAGQAGLGVLVAVIAVIGIVGVWSSGRT